MRRCFQLAIKGMGRVSPNPMVGCVIVYKDRIIGEGFHRKYGENHAEINAIDSVREKELLRKSTLYVNLEPCSHYGKTPPCAERIIKEGIPRVVISCTDLNEKVNGRGIEMLKEAGIDVVTGVLEDEGRELNKRFFSQYINHRPYVIIKWAQSSNTCIAPTDSNGESIGNFLITSPTLNRINHSYRACEDAIMVGSQTLSKDNPQLNIRSFFGKHPLRVSISRHQPLSKHLHFFDGKQPSLIFCYPQLVETYQSYNLGEMLQIVAITPQSPKEELWAMMEHLKSIHIQSLIVEGGSMLLSSFIDNNLWDEARIFTSSQIIKLGYPAPALLDKLQKDLVYETETFGTESIVKFFNH